MVLINTKEKGPLSQLETKLLLIGENLDSPITGNGIYIPYQLLGQARSYARMHKIDVDKFFTKFRKELFAHYLEAVHSGMYYTPENYGDFEKWVASKGVDAYLEGAYYKRAEGDMDTARKYVARAVRLSKRIKVNIENKVSEVFTKPIPVEQATEITPEYTPEQE